MAYSPKTGDATQVAASTNPAKNQVALERHKSKTQPASRRTTAVVSDLTPTSQRYAVRTNGDASARTLVSVRRKKTAARNDEIAKEQI